MAMDSMVHKEYTSAKMLKYLPTILYDTQSMINDARATARIFLPERKIFDMYLEMRYGS